MKIIFINTLYYPNNVGGAERSVQFLAESLVEEGHEAIVLSTIAGSITKISYLNGVKIYYIGIKNIYWRFERQPRYVGLLKPIWHTIDAYNPSMASEVARILDSERPDLVHTNNLAGFSVSVWQVVKKRQIPLVHTIRDYYLICPRKCIMFRNGQNCQKQCWDCKVYSLPKQQNSNLVDAAIAISRHVLDNHLNLQYFAQVPVKQVIHNSYQPQTLSTTQGSCLRLGYLGRIEKMKGFDLLLDALGTLSTQNWELRVGGRLTEEQIEHLRNQYPYRNIHYLGYVKPEEFFSSVDVLVVPSLWQEPLGRIVLEAYAHGVPAIGSNRGGIPEIIESGRTGFIFEPTQERSLTVAIEEFINNPALAAEMGKHALRKSQEFAPRKILQAYLDVYEKVSGKSIRGDRDILYPSFVNSIGC